MKNLPQLSELFSAPTVKSIDCKILRLVRLRVTKQQQLLTPSSDCIVQMHTFPCCFHFFFFLVRVLQILRRYGVSSVSRCNALVHNHCIYRWHLHLYAMHLCWRQTSDVHCVQMWGLASGICTVTQTKQRLAFPFSISIKCLLANITHRKVQRQTHAHKYISRSTIHLHACLCLRTSVVRVEATTNVI